ncbi:hypothetical protein GCM10023403_53990 [Pseudonocardia benzenivorans]
MANETVGAICAWRRVQIPCRVGALRHSADADLHDVRPDVVLPPRRRPGRRRVRCAWGDFRGRGRTTRTTGPPPRPSRASPLLAAAGGYGRAEAVADRSRPIAAAFGAVVEVAVARSWSRVAEAPAPLRFA